MSTLSNYYIISLIINNNLFPQPPPSSWFSIFLLFKVCSSCNFHSALKHFLFVSHLFSQLCKSKRETRKKRQKLMSQIFFGRRPKRKISKHCLFFFLKKQREEKFFLFHFIIIVRTSIWFQISLHDSKRKEKKSTHKQKDRGVSSDRNLNIFTVKNYFSVVLFFSCAM